MDSVNRHDLQDYLLQVQDEVRSEFQWDLEDDYANAKWLVNSLISGIFVEGEEGQFDAAWPLVKSELLSWSGNVVIVGAAAQASEIEDAMANGCKFLIADGSGGVFSHIRRPDLAWDLTVGVVTDGDGGQGLIEAVKRAIPLIIHAHGDNRKELEALIRIMGEQNVSLTHQTPYHIKGMRNPGGFTDGDRAVCIALSMGVKFDRIVLVGTRSDEIGRFSGATDPIRKFEKLKWMKRILNKIGFDDIK